jgi:hypothetical protein
MPSMREMPIQPFRHEVFGMSKISMMIAGFVAVIVAGCGDSGPALVTVKGTVMYKDKPLEGADLTFTPDGSNTNGLMGGDVTGPAGDYSALSNGRRGLVPGKYKVTIRKVTGTDPTASGAGGEANPSPNLKRLELMYAKTVADKSGKKTVAIPSNIEKIVGTFEREVPPEGGVIDFDVKSQSQAIPVAKQ